MDLFLTTPAARIDAAPGTARKYTIMRFPPKGTAGSGEVPHLVPPVGLLTAIRDGSLSRKDFATALEERWSTSSRLNLLAPGPLYALRPGGQLVRVESGDILTCTCAAGAFCHRRVAAPVLARAGWRVWLDGVEVPADTPLLSETLS
jgi:hypothetical protein